MTISEICQAWVEDGRANDCFWEGWPECPTPDDDLTPQMILDEFDRLRAALEEVRRDCMMRAQASRDGKTVPLGASCWMQVCAALDGENMEPSK